ncbi:MAG: hypothetical protein MUP98_20725 [Candidatus Aminicenantes bacterium]|nr:hypothetical protein [Candidatus Aminicenantes bacterium]
MREEFGLPLDMPPFKGKIHPDYRNVQFLEEIFDCHSLLSHPSCEILLDSRNRIGKVELPISETRMRTVVIKEFRIRGIDKLKTAIQPSKALKAWWGASALYQKGFNTPCPVAYLENRKGRFVEQSYFISEMIKDGEEIRFLFPRLEPDKLKELLSALAGYLSRIQGEGLFHWDLSDGNILVKRNGEGYEFYLIDTNRVREKKKVRALRQVKSLVRLGIPRDFQKYFLKQHFKADKLPSLIWFWYRFNKVRFSWFIELKKKLRLKKIAQKLKIQ